MKKKILVKLISVVFILGLVKSSIVLAQEQVKNKEQQEQKNIEQQKNEKQQQNLKQQEQKNEKQQKNVEQQEQKNVEQQEQKNVEQQEKKLSPQEEKEQQKQKDIKAIEEALKKFKSLEEQMQKKLNNMFKDFKKEDFEVKNYDLEVFKKNNVPILVYTHKKTGAQVYFNLILDKDEAKKGIDQLIFRAPSKDDRGLTHFGEHCIAGPVGDYFWKKLKCGGDVFNAHTSAEGLTFASKAGSLGVFNEKLEKEYVKRLGKELTSPSVFEKDDKLFQIEKRRIINESKDRPYENYLKLMYFKKKFIRNYNFLGETSKLAKVSLKDFKRFFEKYIHPSNCLLIKNVFELNPKTIKNCLNMWHENYFKNFNKKQIEGLNYKLKKEDGYLFESWPKDSSIFKSYEEKTEVEKNSNKKLDFKYLANLDYDVEDLKQTETRIVEISLDPFKGELNNLVKNLGYEKINANAGNILFYGNKKDLFSQKVLKENAKKIMNFISNKLKSLKEEDYLYYTYNHLKNFNKFQLNELNLKNADLWSKPENSQGFKMIHGVLQTFFQIGKVISNLNFLVNDKKEIESSYESLDKYVKQSLKEKFNFYDKLAVKGPKRIDVFEKSDKTIKQTYKKEFDKYETLIRVLPVKLKDEKSNKFVSDFAAKLLSKYLTEELNRKQGLIYAPLASTNCFENNFKIAFWLNKDSVKNLEDYFLKNFDEINKKIVVKEADLNELKKQFKENFNSLEKKYKEYSKNENKIIKDFENYIKTGKIDKNSVLKKDYEIGDYLLEYVPFYLIYPLINSLKKDLKTFNKNCKDYEDYFEIEMSFKEKYLKKAHEKATPEFLKDFFKNLLLPTLKKIKSAFKLAEEKFKALDKIEFLDVKNLIKTAYLVKDKEEVEKANKRYYKTLKRKKNFEENLLG